MPNLTPRSILLATGNTAVQKCALADLQDAEYAVQVTTEGAAALAGIEASAPDLLIVDADMNTPEGETLVLYLSAHAQYSFLPILIVLAKRSQVPEWIWILSADRMYCFITVPFGRGERHPTSTEFSRRLRDQKRRNMDTPDIIEFEPRYTEPVKYLLAAVLQHLDLPDVPEIEASAFCPPYDDGDLDQIMEIYTRRSRFWVAIGAENAGAAVVGMVAIREVDAGTALLRRMFVAHAYHGAGLGRRLLDTALDFARSQGYDTVTLDTHIGMKRAHAFYEKHGFRLTGAERGSGITRCSWRHEPRQQIDPPLHCAAFPAQTRRFTRW